VPLKVLTNQEDMPRQQQQELRALLLDLGHRLMQERQQGCRWWKQQRRLGQQTQLQVRRVVRRGQGSQHHSRTETTLSPVFQLGACTQVCAVQMLRVNW
jgi:hypothetical protein